ncbi:hypothetical protein BDQ17DRAFT_1434460 [Cyathus striatus]|nr:hypothetical protein BDQ17DRAFT_1434460 [Cyathus striatus]
MSLLPPSLATIFHGHNLHVRPVLQVVCSSHFGDREWKVSNSVQVIKSAGYVDERHSFRISATALYPPTVSPPSKVIILLLLKPSSTQFIMQHYRNQLNTAMQLMGNTYKLFRDDSWTGPQHCPLWTTIYYINDVEYGRGQGLSKDESAENAASVVLEALRRIQYQMQIQRQRY